MKSPGAFVLLLACLIGARNAAGGDDWPRWRGADGSGVADGFNLPSRWTTTDGIRWSTEIGGEGSSSPIVVGPHVFVTAAHDLGRRRELICLDRDSGAVKWRREIEDPDPEVASSLTGHAAATPAAGDERVVAAFGRAGLVCWNFAGNLQWRFDLGAFESELGLANSPIIVDGKVVLVCDHDGNRFTSFDSYLLAVDLISGREIWRTPRPGLGRSWSTPVVAPQKNGVPLLLVNGQDELRAYDATDGRLVWGAPGQTGWVTPSPVVARGLAFATSGKQGPVMALHIDVAEGEDRTAWRRDLVGPYVCSPIAYRDWLFVLDEAGVLFCYDALSGRNAGRRRLEGKFLASPAAGDGKLYCINDEGVTFVVAADPSMEILASNDLEEPSLASPAIAAGSLYLRTAKRLWRIDAPP